ncbi:Gfo/Idh/MocA family oxidoreductase [Yinghuangia sp. ASG 101]|uniref:Gfo/Idh/MocA family oxidoreductase n=1 Tax=Yinghuangia sp. ASG 101 TaxID=2896848 RepID=UPI001E327122|nr:Gfo/Idh/MocA family oxidoreductase [Yinghuangia sp. ASG 101]UGQ09739.1 Gfo/Idh/MocA family oxidoreductase [Yinghuangia sp. ASG 101]
MNTTEPLRTALIGYGLGGAAFHAPFLAALPEYELSAVVTGNPERAAAVRARYGDDVEVIPAATELFARGDAFDVAVVTVPNRFHAAFAREALDAGLHVVVDKPFAGTAHEGRSLAALAEAHGRTLCVYQNRRWDGDFRTLRGLIAYGRLGAVHRFESRFERWRPEPVRDAWKEDADPAALGGILYDLGSHLVDQAVALFGRPRLVYAELDRGRPGVVVDDDSFVALTHAGGVRSHLWMSATAADLGPRLRVLGGKAAYVKYGMDVQEAALRAGGVPGSPGWGTEPADAWGRVGTPGDEEAVPTLPGAYQDFYRAFAAALRGEGPVPVPVAESVTVLEVIEAAQRSSRDGVAVALGAGG